MNTKMFVALSVLLIASLACGNLTLNAQPFATQTTSETCQRGWEIKPAAMYQYPIDDLTKLVIVDLGFKNGSKYWGKINSISIGDNGDTNVVMTSEDGSIFQPIDYNPTGTVYNLPSNPKSIYSGKPYGESSSWIHTNWIAPGGIVNGIVFPKWANSEIYHYHFAFRVPTAQNHFVAKISNLELTCFGVPSKGADGKIYTDTSEDSRLPAFNLKLDTDIGQLKTDLGLLPNIGGEVKLTDNQSIYFNEVSRTEGVIKIEYSISNTDIADYYVIFTPYVVGEDGIQRYADCDSVDLCQKLGIFNDGDWNDVEFEVPAGQTINQVLFFSVPSDIKNLVFVLNSGGDSAFPGVGKLFNLNP